MTVPGALVPNISGSYYTIIALFSNIVLPYIVYNISEIKKLNTNCINIFKAINISCSVLKAIVLDMSIRYQLL